MKLIILHSRISLNYIYRIKINHYKLAHMDMASNEAVKKYHTSSYHNDKTKRGR